MSDRLEGKVCIITGTGGSMGRAAALMFAAQGAKVVGCDINREAAQATVDEVLSLGGDMVSLSECDLTDTRQCKLLVDLAVSTWGRIDVLVNSAGHGPRAPILDISDDDWHKGLDTYLLNVVRAVRIVTPIMQKQRSGSIINISTAWAFEPSEMFPTSAVFRAGLASYTKIFADTYAKDNIRINNILPGWIDSLPATDARRESVPMQRYGKSEEIAATVAFLASDGAGYITGQNIRVDGGITRSI